MSNLEKRKVPKRRFKEFENAPAWEQRKLGEVAEITMGQSPRSSNYTDNPSDYILVQGNADMKDGKVFPKVWTTEITKTANCGDIILSVRAPVGEVGKTEYNVVLGRGVSGVKGNEFIFQSLKKMNYVGYWNRFSTGSTFESINSNDIKDAKITIPSEQEQKQIGSFFNQLDTLITLQQRKLNKLNNLKKSYLAEMFPAEGERKPKRRFAGFTDDWEQRELGDNLKSIHTGTSLLGSDSNLGMPLLKMGNINRGYFSLNKIEFLRKDANIDNLDLVKKGDFLFNTRNTLELVGKGATWTGTSDNYAFNSNIARFTFKGIDTVFFNYLYNTESMIKQIHSRATGTTSVAAVYPRDIVSISYLIPKLTEQKKIGCFFNQLDNLITLHQRKIDKLKKLKDAYLNEMFV
ncbi:restriction endonuclease subunit S [Lactobacillus sp. ESL0228]|uniref:restriction endonuclease subunit S n=1 Tax=Lactobacillus sp. ESL0228 TaxID=2069352 RepID=UPI000EFDAACE|nr:restriction endonuclease subunit S [Lactobacillus sp. ESL0228]RMC49560.1 restriction endonuclease subunit S [Lactobacillus sp. ESL0228]